MSGTQATKPGWIKVVPETELWKHLKKPHLRRDGSVNSSVYCFDSRPDPSISVDIASLTTFRDVRNRRGNNIGVGRLMAAVPLQMELTVRHDPTVGPPAGDNDAHAVIEAIKSFEEARRLADGTVCILSPEEPIGD
jgi:hypothetical protein